MVEIRLKFIIILKFIDLLYFEICKNYFKILGQKKKKEKRDGNDMVFDVAQHECSNIKQYVSAFSNI